MLKKTISFSLALVILAFTLFTFASCIGGGKTRLGESEDILPREAAVIDFEVTEDFKMGLICLHDENSTYDYNFIKAFKEVAEAMNLTKDQYIIYTNIPEGAECKTKAEELVNKGCKLIFADSFGHEAFMADVAKNHPEVQFCHASGDGAASDYKDLPNFHNAFASIYEGRYLAGIVAGMKLNEMIESGKITADKAIIGYVGAYTYAEVVSGMTSFYLGARSVCPTATMKVKYTGSWYDQSKEQEVANSLIEQEGCVLISQHADSLGAPTACELKGVPNVSYNGSTYSAGKSTFLISSAINWTPYFTYAAKCVCTGTEIAKNYTGTIESNSVVLSGINLDVAPEGSKEAVEAAIEKFKAGTLKVFDTSKFTVNGQTLTEYLADVDGDFAGETNVIHDGYFDESGAAFRSAPYFNIIIDGVTNLNENFG